MSAPGGSGLFATLVESFILSTQFQQLAQNSRLLWERELRQAGDVAELGALSVEEIRPSLIQRYLDGLNGRPGKQTAALAALRALNKWARVRDLLPQSIIEGVSTEHPEGGHVPWTEAQVVEAERHARPDLARVITLGACTGQRISDLVRMAWTDIETHHGYEGINVVQKKTGRQLWVPVSERLSAALTAWGRRDVGPILLRGDTVAWRSEYLTDHWDYEKKINDHLRDHLQAGLVLHGLRGYRCVQLSRDGLTDHQIADVVGMSIRMVERYTRLSSQKENALAAMRTSRERPR